MTFRKGMSRPPRSGRKKGTANHTTATIKEILNDAFGRLGGVEGMLAWAKKSNVNRTEFYRLWARLLPLEVKANHSGDVGLSIVTDVELDKRMRETERRLADLVAKGIADGTAGDSPPSNGPESVDPLFER